MKIQIIGALKRHLVIPVMICVLLITKIFTNYSVDILLFIILGTFGIGAYIISNRTKHKLILRLFSLYIILNFLFFPIVYLTLLKYSTNSFEFDKAIFTYEKHISFTELSSEYNINKLKSESEIIKLIFTDSTICLDTTLNYLNQGNAILLKDYILTKNCIPVNAHRPMYRAVLNVCDVNGNNIGQIENMDEGCSLTKSDQTIKQFLETRLVLMNDKKTEYNSKGSEIVEGNNIWKYRQLLPYTLNIFTTDNMVPKTKMANIIFYIHQIIVATVIISIIIGVIQNYLTKGKIDDKNGSMP